MANEIDYFTRLETNCPYCYLKLINARGLRAHLPFCKDKKELDQLNSDKHDPIPDPLTENLRLNDYTYNMYDPADDFDDSLNDGDVMTEDTRFVSTEGGFDNNVKVPNVIYENKDRDNGINTEFQQRYGFRHPDTLTSKGIQTYSLMQEEFYDKIGIKEALGAKNLEEYCEIVQSKPCTKSFKESKKRETCLSVTYF